jgi:hypothetical protein
VFIGITLANKYDNNPTFREYYEVTGNNNNNDAGYVPIEANNPTVLVNEDPELDTIKQYDVMDNEIYERNIPSTSLYDLEEDKENNSIVTVRKILPYFNEGVQFNQDYRDVMTSINDLVPAQKQVFNVANIPLTDYSEPNPSSVMEMTIDFINSMNEISKKNTTNFDNRKLDGYLNYGWTDKLVEKNVESGWNKVQKSLGLQPSLYMEPAPYRPLKLVAIKKVQKYETDDQTKVVIYMVLHKPGVIDQIMLRVSLVIDKSIIRDQNNFFNVKVNYENDNDYTFKPDFNVQVVVEEINILGYFTNKYGTFKAEDFGIKYAKYDELGYNNMTSNKYIRKVLLDKYNKRNDEINKRNATLDDQGRIFHSTMSGVGDYCNLGLSATIFDDIDAPRLFC